LELVKARLDQLERLFDKVAKNDTGDLLNGEPKSVSGLNLRIPEALQKLLSSKMMVRGDITPPDGKEGFEEETTGVRYRRRYIDNLRSIEELGLNPLSLQEEKPTARSWWLTVTEVAKARPGLLQSQKSWEMTIADTDLRDYIRNTLAAYIAHTGKATWQEPEVVIGSNFSIIVHNMKILEAKAESESLELSHPLIHERLGIFLKHIRGVVDLQLVRQPEPGPAIKDFRIEFKHLWSLFKPGNLIVSLWNQAEEPQVFKINNVQHHLEFTFLLVTAWVWDWNGTKLVRSMFQFMIDSYQEAKSPTELRCYPIEFYEGENGRLGKAAMHRSLNYRNRRELFLKYTVQQKKSSRVLRYSGDVLRGTQAFPTELAIAQFESLVSQHIFSANDDRELRRTQRSVMGRLVKVRVIT
jgi:hypothetical protein